MVQRKKILAIDKSAFPNHEFFYHLQQGTQYYQDGNYERATEEWGAAKRLHYTKQIPLKKVNGKISCGAALDKVPFLFTLYAVYSNKIDGIGVLKNNSTTKKILFNQGMLVRAGTTRIEERIGRFILNKNKVSEQGLAQMVKESKDHEKRIGEYLVQKGHLSQEDLREVLALQVEEILSDVLNWTNGAFYVFEGGVNREAGISYTPLQFALGMARRGFNFTDFRNRIPNNKIIFRHSPYLDRDSEDILQELNIPEQYIFSLIDGARNIQQLIHFSGADEVTVINILYGLSEKGLIRKTKEVIEYEDTEYNEIIKFMEVLFEVYRLMTEELFRELGKRGQTVIRDAKRRLSPTHQKMFEGFPLEDPSKMQERHLFRNMAQYFPAPDDRYIFIDAFHALYRNILEELNRFLGIGLTKKTSEAIRKKISDIERFGAATGMKNRLLEVLNLIGKPK